MALKKEDDNPEADKNTGDTDSVNNSQNAQADRASVTVGGVNIGGDLNGEVNIAGRDIHHHYILQNYLSGARVHRIEPPNQPPYQRRSFPVHLVPADFPTLLDRTRERERAKDAIQASTPVSISGEKGIGKTAFIRYLIHHTERSAFSSGVVCLNVSGRGFDDLLQLLFEQFFDSLPGFKVTDTQIRHEFQELDALVFLDDLEPDIGQVTTLQDYAPGCTFVLAAVEQSLWEEVKRISLKGLPEEEAVTLFEREFDRLNEDRALNEEEQAAVRKLCPLYHGNPWRILFAASLVAQQKVSIFQILQESERADPQEALLQAARKTLTDDQDRVLAILASVGGAKLPEEHLVFLSQDLSSSKTLRGLIELRLIKEQNGSYSLVGNLASLLSSELDLSEWEDRLLDHFTGWLEQKPAQARMEESMEALIYLLKKTSKKEQWFKVIRFGRALEPGLILGKRWGAWAELLHQISNAAKALGDKDVGAWVVHQLGSRAMCLGKDDEARELLTLALDLRKQIHDNEGLEVTQHNLDVLLRVPAPTEIPRKPSLPKWPKLRWPGGWIGPGLGFAALGVTALIFFLFRGSPVSPVPTDTPTTAKTLTLAASFTPTRTPSPTPTASPSRTPSNTPSATSTPSPTVIAFSTGTPQLSTSQLFFSGAGCDPNSLTIRVSAQNPTGIKVMVFYQRLHEVVTKKDSGWSSGLAMSPTGDGTYTLSVTGDQLIGESGITRRTSMSYQFAIETKNGDTIRSDVYTGVSLLPCRQSFSVPVDGSIVWSDILRVGITYRITASGTFDDSLGVSDADAEYTDIVPLYPESKCFQNSIPVDVGIVINDIVQNGKNFPDWGPYNPAHVYTYTYVGQDKAISFRYRDCIYSDNKGSLKVEISSLK